MLESLTIRDFQAHEKLKIDFHPHVTTLLGKTDSGKSSIIRAIRWLATNKPSGDAFIRDGQEQAKAALVVDGQTVTRVRGKDRNTYSLNGEPLKAFGQDVPDEVAKLLNVGDSNFQQQHDAPFWFSSSAGEVSRKINEVVDLGLIDNVLSHLGSKLREATTRVAIAVEGVAQAKSTRRQLIPILWIASGLKGVEASEISANQARQNATTLRLGVEDAQRYAQAQENAATAAAAGEEAVQMGDGWAKLLAQRDGLNALYEKAKDLEGVSSREIPDTAHLVGMADKWEGLQESEGVLLALVEQAGDWLEVADRDVPDIKYLEEMSDITRVSNSRKETLAALVFEAGGLADREESAKTAVVEAESNYEKSMGKTCPVCGKPR